MVHPGIGYRGLAKQVRSGNLLLKGITIIVCLVSRADVLDLSKSVMESVLEFWQAVDYVDSACILLLATLLPWPGATPQIYGNCSIPPLCGRNCVMARPPWSMCMHLRSS